MVDCRTGSSSADLLREGISGLLIVGKFADDTERILKLIGAQNAGPGEDDDDEDIEHENDQ